ncbi:MAG: competence/damage-inducible protein A [Bacteroidales bacterium]|nr:competence/damage-inducible protein A [Bacteroidales bacterium]
MNCDIITIGDEILIGQVTDTNSSFIGSILTSIGVKVRQIITVGDNEQSISHAISQSLQNSDIIILTGGLGPTNDDITKNTLAKLFNTKLERSPQVLSHITCLLQKRGIELTEKNRSQADIPTNCIALYNKYGTAPGMLIQAPGNKIVVSLPGVPFEMESIFTEEFVPWLTDNVRLPLRLQQTFLVAGVPESVMAERLQTFEKEMPKAISLAYLPSPGLLRLRLGFFATDHEKDLPMFEELCRKLETILGSDLFGYNNDTLERIVGNLLAKHNFTVCTAESCTGGNIARMITGVPGASQYFNGSIIAYSNSIKESILQINPADLDNFGAVSQQVVSRMAENAKKVFKTDFSIATSGIAGPTGGTIEKPVGTVWVSVSSPNGTNSVRFQFGEHRGRTITRSTLAALNMLRLEILKIVEKTVEKV